MADSTKCESQWRGEAGSCRSDLGFRHRHGVDTNELSQLRRPRDVWGDRSNLDCLPVGRVCTDLEPFVVVVAGAAVDCRLAGRDSRALFLLDWGGNMGCGEICCHPTGCPRSLGVRLGCYHAYFINLGWTIGSGDGI